ncbi:MAG: MFS transporter [Candidatus Saccharimonadales bacterium]
MNSAAQNIQRIYLMLILGNTLAASLIWGINTLFLLDAGLSNFEAFLANAFFTLGMVIFEIPTGVIADTVGRRASYLLGTLTLAVTTAAYFFMWQAEAPFVLWAVVSMLLGLGFTFFSGAVEAWLVDAMQAVKYEGELESVFGKGQVVGGIAMLGGSVLGGVIAQVSSLGVPYILRAVVLVGLFVLAFVVMKDVGFEPDKSQRPLKAMRSIFTASVRHGLGNPPVRWIMLAAPFTASVGFYVFYALQPYLLQLYGNETAYSIAGLAAAIVAGAQIAGGMLAGKIRQLFRRRTTAIVAASVLSIIVVLGLGITTNFYLALVLMAAWGLLFAAVMPIRQAYLNGLIPSKQRATVLSFDSLMGNSGGIVIQPVLGRVADVNSYGQSFIVGAAIQIIALPFLLKSRTYETKADGAKSE